LLLAFELSVDHFSPSKNRVGSLHESIMLDDNDRKLEALKLLVEKGFKVVFVGMDRVF